MVGVHCDTFSNNFVDLLALKPLHLGIHILVQSGDAPFAVLLLDLRFQVGLRGRHSLPVNNCPCLPLSHALDRLLGEHIADIVDGRFAIARERAMIRDVAIPRRLDNVNGRLVHGPFKMMPVGVEMDTAEVVNQPMHTWKVWPQDWRRCRGSMWHVVLLHVEFRDCLEMKGRVGTAARINGKQMERKLLFIKKRGKHGSSPATV